MKLPFIGKPDDADHEASDGAVVQGEPSTSAAGVTAVRVSLQRVAKEARRGTFRSLFQMNQKGGFDCPGCAWPDPDHRRSPVGEYCENGVKALVEEASAAEAGPDFFASHGIAELRGWDDHRLGKSGRLTEPMYLAPGATHYTPISWDRAFERIGEQLRSLPSPDRAVFYTSGRTSNEAAFLYQLFVRMYGTNNLPDCSNMCHESSGEALSQALGTGTGTVVLDDFEQTDLVLVAGQNPGTNHPRMLNALEAAKRNGARIIAINPLREAGLLNFEDPQRPRGVVGSGTELADLYLQVAIGRDIPLAKALLVRLAQWEREAPGVLDREFISSFTNGFDELQADLDRYDFDELCGLAGVDPGDVETAASWLRDSDRIICCWAMGLTQHEYGVRTIREYLNLLLARGAIGKPGSGTCPVRGHSNVQGDRTMGIWERPPPELLDRLQADFGFAPPREHGLDTVDSIRAMVAGEVDVFFAMGGNFVSAGPDTRAVAEGLARCAMTVHVSTKLNRSHVLHGAEALILPCRGRSEVDRQRAGEQFVTCENSMGIVQSSAGRLDPVSPSLRSEVGIVAGLATATFAHALAGADAGLDWNELAGNYDLIRDRVEVNIPGFDNYNRRVREPGGFYLPNAARDGVFETESGRAEFTINELPVFDRRDGEFLLMTVRSHDQFNTTIYGHDDRYRGLSGNRRVVMANATDIAELGLKPHARVHLESRHGESRRRADDWTLVAYDIPRRCLAAYFPEANVLVPLDQVAEHSNTPASKQVTVRIIAA